MSYRKDSNWDEANEIRCLIIFKKLEAEKFPRGKQIDYCRKLAKVVNLDVGNLSAKVSNYKSVAGVNNPSHHSTNTERIYKKYGRLSVSKLKALLSDVTRP